MRWCAPQLPPMRYRWSPITATACSYRGGGFFSPLVDKIVQAPAYFENLIDNILVLYKRSTTMRYHTFNHISAEPRKVSADIVMRQGKAFQPYVSAEYRQQTAWCCGRGSIPEQRPARCWPPPRCLPPPARFAAPWNAPAPTSRAARLRCPARFLFPGSQAMGHVDWLIHTWPSSSSVLTYRRIASTPDRSLSWLQLFHLALSTTFQPQGLGSLQGPTVAC